MEVIDLIDEELRRVIDAVKLKDEAALLRLQNAPVKKEYEIFGKRYPLIVFSELEPDGALNVVAEITRRHFMGSSTSFSKGFKFKDGVVTNLTEQELWEFD